MSLIKRPGSPFWYINHRFDGDDEPMRVSTRIPWNGGSAKQSRDNERHAKQLESKFILKDPETWERLTGTPLHDQGETFASFAAWWLDHINPRHEGAEREAESVARFVEAFGSLPLGAITVERVDEWLTLQQDTRRINGELIKPQTLNREVDVLKAVIKDAVSRKRVRDLETGKVLTLSPLRGMARLRKISRPKTRITIEQERALLAVIKHPCDRALLIVGIDTLQRLKNLLALKRSHVSNGMAQWLDTKNGTSVELPLSERAQQALAAIPVDPREPDYYFAYRRTAKNPRRWKDIIRVMLYRACARAGIPYGRAVNSFTWHRATRATGASRLNTARFTTKTVQTLGNWKDPRMAAEYMVEDEATLREAVNQIAPPAPPTPPAEAGQVGAKIVQMPRRSA